MTVKVIPPEDPAVVREREGYHPAGSWYSPLRQRPYAFKKLDGQPRSDVREDS